MLNTVVELDIAELLTSVSLVEEFEISEEVVKEVVSVTVAEVLMLKVEFVSVEDLVAVVVVGT